MADPVFSKIIGIKVVGANAGEYVRLRNNTRGDQLTDKLNSALEVIFNPANSSDVQWYVNDEIVAELMGRVTGVKSFKLATGQTTQTITATADTSTPGVSL